MKNRTMRMIVIAAGMLVIAGMVVQAEAEDGKGKGRGDKPGRGPNVERMMEQLDLTQEQKDKLKPLFDEFRKEVNAVREDAKLDPQARRAKFEELRKAHQAKVDAILTAEQKEKMNKLREEGRAKHEELRKKRGPKDGQLSAPPKAE